MAVCNTLTSGGLVDSNSAVRPALWVKFQPHVVSRLKIGDYVKFGIYPQNTVNVQEPIEWLVLDVYGNDVLLVSRYGLDYKQYHNGFDGITWEDCDLRKWLNGEFLRNAFTVAEQK